MHVLRLPRLVCRDLVEDIDAVPELRSRGLLDLPEQHPCALQGRRRPGRDRHRAKGTGTAPSALAPQSPESATHVTRSGAEVSCKCAELREVFRRKPCGSLTKA